LNSAVFRKKGAAGWWWNTDKNEGAAWKSLFRSGTI